MIDIEHLSSFYPDNIKPFKKNILREYLQYKILDIVFNSKYSSKLVFMGGTAIRIIYNSTRFSEALDFDNRGISEDEFIELTEHIKKKLELEGYKLETRVKIIEGFKCHFKFLDILPKTGLSGHLEAKLMIQFDTQPQDYDYTADKKLINKFEVFTNIFVVPVDLLLAQKICAVFTRPRAMGRDFFDIVFLHAQAQPDMKYLDEKLDIKDEQALKRRLSEKCEALDFRQLAKDIEAFIFNTNDSKKVEMFPEYLEAKF